MNRRIGFLAVALAVGGILTVNGAFSKPSPQATRKVIKLAGGPVQAPFSDAILAANTLYLAGRIGIDPKTGKVPEKIEDEIKLLLDGEKEVLAQAGMTMDDLVYVQIACTDLSLFEKFNPIYKSYFTTKDLPAREFPARRSPSPGTPLRSTIPGPPRRSWMNSANITGRP